MYKKSERKIQSDTMIRLSKDKDIRIFRNNVGQAWQGKRAKLSTTNKPVLVDIHPVNFGLCVGSSDLIGIHTIEITPDMVGRKVGVMVCIEEKKEGWKYSGSVHEKNQLHFIEKMMKMGAIAFFSTSAENAYKTIKNWIFG